MTRIEWEKILIDGAVGYSAIINSIEPEPYWP